jgi:hypothetical protein
MAIWRGLVDKQVTAYPRGSFYYIADKIDNKNSCVAAEVGVADTMNIQTWVAEKNDSDKYIRFSDLVLIDNTNNAEFLGCINSFTSKHKFSRFLNIPSIEAADLFPDEYFDFIYIDAAHYYEDVKEDINAWQYKVKVGGFIGGHDYNFFLTPHGSAIEHPEFSVNKAVDEFARSRNVQVVKLHTEFVIRRSW